MRSIPFGESDDAHRQTRRYSLSTESIRKRVDDCAFYTFLFIDLNARAYPDHFVEDFMIHVILDDFCGGYIELHSLITGKCLEWISVENIKEYLAIHS
jgi:hypothetical protein